MNEVEFKKGECHALREVAEMLGTTMPTYANIRKRILDLLAVVERLTTKTADGVLVGHGDSAYLRGDCGWPELENGDFGPCEASGEPGEKLTLSLGSVHGYEDYTQAQFMYSTPEASIEAAKAQAAKWNEDDEAAEAARGSKS